MIILKEDEAIEFRSGAIKIKIIWKILLSYKWLITGKYDQKLFEPIKS